MVVPPSPIYRFHCWGEGGVAFSFLVMGKWEQKMEKVFVFLKQIGQKWPTPCVTWTWIHWQVIVCIHVGVREARQRRPWMSTNFPRSTLHCKWERECKWKGSSLCNRKENACWRLPQSLPLLPTEVEFSFSFRVMTYSNRETTPKSHPGLPSVRSLASMSEFHCIKTENTLTIYKSKLSYMSPSPNLTHSGEQKQERHNIKPNSEKGKIEK